MRVLVLMNMYPPHALGGYEQTCHDVVRRFAAAGHEVHVLTTDTRLPGVADVDEPNVARTLRWYWHDHRIVRPRLRETVRLERHNRGVLTEAMQRLRPDVVSVWAMGGMSMSLLHAVEGSGRPAVYVVCDEWPVYGPLVDGWLSRFRGRAGRPLRGVAARVTGLPTTLVEPRRAAYLWVSDYIRTAALAATGWQPRHEAITGWGIDTTDFPLDVTPPRPRWHGRLLCVGRVEPRKGFDVAVRALAGLPPETTLRIVGPDDGSYAGQLRALAAELGVADRVTFGALPRGELRPVYAEADAVLFTSAWQEPFGLVPIEAMASATPVVAHATGGAAEFLAEGGNCLVVPPNDPAALAAAVSRLGDDPDLRHRLVAGGRETARHYTVDRLADEFETWHRAAVDGDYPGS